MKFGVFFFVGILLLSFTSCSKDLNLWTRQSNIQEAEFFEFEVTPQYGVSFNRHVVLSESVYPNVNDFKIGKPKIYWRGADKILPVYAEYFFSEPDSILRFVSYNWELNRYDPSLDKGYTWEDESEKLKDFNKEYERIKKLLIRENGKPNTKDDTPHEISFGESIREPYFGRKTIWEDDYKYMQLNMVFEELTQRIRLYYFWK